MLSQWEIYFVAVSRQENQGFMPALLKIIFTPDTHSIWTPNYSQSILSQWCLITYFDSVMISCIKNILHHVCPKQVLIHVRYSFGEKICFIHEKHIGTGQKKVSPWLEHILPNVCKILSVSIYSKNNKCKILTGL